MSHIGLEGHLEKEEKMREEGLKKKQKTKDNREARKTQSGLNTISNNIVREKKKEENEERNLEQENNKAIRGGKRSTKEAYKSNNAKLRLARKASKNNRIKHLNRLNLEHFFDSFG